MLQAFITTLNDNCQEIERLQNSHGSEVVSVSLPSASTTTTGPPSVLAWQEKSPYLETLVDSTTQVAQSCIKCALIVGSAKQEELDSITFEITSYAEIVRNTFWKFVATVKPDSLLQKSASKLVKSLLVHTRDFMASVLNKNVKNTATGAEMVRVVAEEFKKLPKTHKAVSRRFIMGKCVQIKDTTREFAEYAAESEKALLSERSGASSDTAEAEAKKRQTTSADVDEEEEEDEEDDDENDFDDEELDDEEEVQYTAEEMPVVHNSIALFHISLEVLKCALNVLTMVCDSVNGIPNISNAVPAELQTTAAVVGTVKSDAGTLALCDSWIAAVITHCDEIERSITDLGAELYPPDLADNRDVIMRHSLDIHTAVQLLVALMQDATFVPFQTEDLCRVVAELSSRVTAYQWIDFQ